LYTLNNVVIVITVEFFTNYTSPNYGKCQSFRNIIIALHVHTVLFLYSIQACTGFIYVSKKAISGVDTIFLGEQYCEYFGKEHGETICFSFKPFLLINATTHSFFSGTSRRKFITNPERIAKLAPPSVNISGRMRQTNTKPRT